MLRLAILAALFVLLPAGLAFALLLLAVEVTLPALLATLLALTVILLLLTIFVMMVHLVSPDRIVPRD